MAQPTIQSKQVQHHCSGFGIYIIYIWWYMHGIHWYTRGIRWYTRGIRWYTLVYAGVRWYTHGIRAVYAWYTRGFCGIRVVYARYTLGICVVYAWYTLVYAHDPPAPKRWEPPAGMTACGKDRQWWWPPAVTTASGDYRFLIVLLFSIHDLKLSLAFKMEGGKFRNHRKLNMN